MDAQIIPEPSAFEYERTTPLDVHEAGYDTIETATLHDLSFANPVAARASAYLVEPKGSGPFPAVMFLHWGQGDRSTFLSEALAYAESGVESLLIDESRMSHFMPTNMMSAEGARTYLIQCVTDLPGMDLLHSRYEVDSSRIGYVGFSLGASVGGQFAGIEKRVKAHVLMAGFPDPSRGWNAMHQNPEEFRRLVGPLDGVHYVGNATPSALLFQWAARDEFVTSDDLDTYFNAANEPKEKQWYEADHSFNHEALCDRGAWLGSKLGFAPPSPERLKRVHLPQRDLEFLNEIRRWFPSMKR